MSTAYLFLPSATLRFKRCQASHNTINRIKWKSRLVNSIEVFLVRYILQHPPLGGQLFGWAARSGEPEHAAGVFAACGAVHANAHAVPEYLWLFLQRHPTCCASQCASEPLWRTFHDHIGYSVRLVVTGYPAHRAQNKDLQAQRIGDAVIYFLTIVI